MAYRFVLHYVRPSTDGRIEVAWASGDPPPAIPDGGTNFNSIDEMIAWTQARLLELQTDHERFCLPVLLSEEIAKNPTLSNLSNFRGRQITHNTGTQNASFPTQTVVVGDPR